MHYACDRKRWQPERFRVIVFVSRRKAFGELSSDVVDAISKLDVQVAELRFEAIFNRATTLVVLIFLIERLPSLLLKASCAGHGSVA